VRITISRPFLSSISNLPRGKFTSSKGKDNGPIEVVVQDLNGCRLDPSSGFLRYGNEYWWIWFANHVTFFTLPLEFVSLQDGLSAPCIDVNRHDKPAHPSHLKFHRNDNVPTYFSSTTRVGLQSSSVLNLVVGEGEVAVINNDSERGSIKCR
jgi:hypothetical protein